MKISFDASAMLIIFLASFNDYWININNSFLQYSKVKDAPTVGTNKSMSDFIIKVNKRTMESPIIVTYWANPEFRHFYSTLTISECSQIP